MRIGMLFLSLVLPAALLGACAGSASQKSAEQATPANRMADSADAHEGHRHNPDDPYCCPMHPNETSAEAGSMCPMCGMRMEARSGDAQHPGDAQHQMMNMDPATSATPTPTETPAASEASRRIEIAIVKKGFQPARVTVHKGRPVTLVFTRKTDETCTKEVIVQLGDGKTIKKDLPLNQPVSVSATFAKSGTLSYACGMNMHTGVISVE